MLPPGFLLEARALIAARSVTDEGNLPAVEVLEDLWKAAGFETHRLPSDDTPERDANLLGGPIGHGPGSPLLLVTHLDTVTPGPRDRWRHDPFELTVEGDRAYGLGAADVKLDALCKLHALRRIDPASLARPVWFLGTYGEEAGLRGARAFLRNPPFLPRFVLCGEPSSLALHDAHKGYAMVRLGFTPTHPTRLPAGPRTRLSFTGRAAHSSTPALGVNAIDLALAAVADLRAPIVSLHGGSSSNAIPAACEVVLVGHVRAPPGATATWFESPEAFDLTALVAPLSAHATAWQDTLKTLSPKEDPRFDPAAAVGSATLLRTHGATLELNLDARLLPAHDVDAFHDAIADRLQRLPRGGAVVTRAIERAANGMSLPPDCEIVRRVGPVLGAAGLDPSPRAKPTSTEGGVFVRAGCEALVFGPSPSTGNAHAANEYALLSELERAIDLYEGMIRALAAP